VKRKCLVRITETTHALPKVIFLLLIFGWVFGESKAGEVSDVFLASVYLSGKKTSVKGPESYSHPKHVWNGWPPKLYSGNAQLRNVSRLVKPSTLNDYVNMDMISGCQRHSLWVSYSQHGTHALHWRNSTSKRDNLRMNFNGRKRLYSLIEELDFKIYIFYRWTPFT